LPFCHAELRAPKPKSVYYPKQINSLGDHIRTRRLDLKLLQKAVGDLIGVDGLTITNWERNATAPAIRYIPSIIEFLGYDPLRVTGTLPERLTTTRRALGLSQQKMAKRLGIDAGTLHGWEAAKHQPSQKSMAVIDRVLCSR
jgi:transcriptional regulator with XRE-family HTH domain